MTRGGNEVGRRTLHSEDLMENVQDENCPESFWRLLFLREEVEEVIRWREGTAVGYKG